MLNVKVVSQVNQRVADAIFATGCFLIATLVLMGLTTQCFADKVIMRGGRSVEGVITENNNILIKINVEGNLLTIPQSRVEKIILEKPEQNARDTLDQITAAMAQGDLHTARTLIEQMRMSELTDIAMNERLVELDDELTSLERRGGTAEERSAQAKRFYTRAMDAFDRTQNNEGYRYLLEALISDPEFEEAHERLEVYFAKPDTNLLLAGEYFYEVLWPDHLRSQSPVINRLPEIYAQVLEEFRVTNDVKLARLRGRILKSVYEALSQNPDWLISSSAQESHQFLNQSLEDQLGPIIEEDFACQRFKLAQEKLRAFARPEDSPYMAELFARAYLGRLRLDTAYQTLWIGAKQFPTATFLSEQASGVRLLQMAEKAEEAGNEDASIISQMQVYTNPQDFLPETHLASGRMLAERLVDDMQLKSIEGPSYEAGDIAAMVLVYREDYPEREKAEKILAQSLPVLPWQLRVQWYCGAEKMELGDQAIKAIETSLNDMTGLTFDENSHFWLDLEVHMTLSADRDRQVALAIATDRPEQTIEAQPPVSVRSLTFKLKAHHPALGTLWEQRWQPNDRTFVVLDDVGKFMKFIRGDMKTLCESVIQNIKRDWYVPSLQELIEREKQWRHQ